MRDTVRDLLHLATDIHAVGQISPAPSVLALATLSPDGPLQDYEPAPIPEQIPKTDPLHAIDDPDERAEPSVEQ